jgi:M6 family metalloprotease-like protein
MQCMRIGAATALLGLVWCGTAAAVICGELGIVAQDGLAKATQTIRPARGEVRAAVLFARFADEEAVGVPAFANDFFAAGLPGSLSHFYAEMSRGQFLLSGEVIPQRYASEQGADAYVSEIDGQVGGFGRFVVEVLEAADEEIDWGAYDNDGPDGQANSGDDDGYVDFVFINMLTTPSGFLISEATGLARLGLGSDFVSGDRRSNGGFIKVRADSDVQGVGGTVQRAHVFDFAVGTMAHEFGHFLGLPDLYDTDFTPLGDELSPEDDSAGIGAWGLMGLGTLGWNGAGGPNPFSSWSLGQLGWLGVDNVLLRSIDTDLSDVVFDDVNRGGAVYRLTTQEPGVFYLLEHRRNDGSYYERNLPGQGLLIWRVDSFKGGNSDEAAKLVDLVCADGLYRDAGFPDGQVPGFERGGDNLDYWAHDEAYTQEHRGNIGDATDVFDGLLFTEYSPASNPAAPSGISIENIRRQGNQILADIRVRDRRRAGAVLADQVWSDTVDVVADVVVPPGVTLTLDQGVVVRFGADVRAGGADVLRAELEVQGQLLSFNSRRPAILTSASRTPRPGDWYGVDLASFGILQLESVQIEYAYNGISGDNVANRQQLRDVAVLHSESHGLRLTGLQEGIEAVDLRVEDAGDTGAVLAGPGIVRIEGGRFGGNADGGLVRRGGFLAGSNLEFIDNATSSPDAAHLTLQGAVSGGLETSTMRGATGLRLEGTGSFLVVSNRFIDMDVGIESISSSPEIHDNEFSGNDVVLSVSGFRVPEKIELNAITTSVQLVRNSSVSEVVAANNWWGTADEAQIAAAMSGPVVWRPFLNFDPRLPFDFGLADNYPNPFNASTVIGFNVGVNFSAVSGTVLMVLDIRNAAGGLVRRLVQEPAAPGRYSAVWDGRNDAGEKVASGVYFYRLDVPPIRFAKSMLLLR